MRGAYTSSLLLLAVVTCMGCRPSAEPPAKTHDISLVEARRGFKTNLLERRQDGCPVDEPPAALFRIVHYPAPGRELPAYLSVRPPDDAKHPLIIWLLGGFTNSISRIAWEPAPAENDQSARAFREAGLLMMYPSLRGGNLNGGWRENFYGEVDDVLAAAAFAAKLDYVDPRRIYLGGHSTGGTTALLAVEMGGPFRAIFSFGPMDHVAAYGRDELSFDLRDERETSLRSPIEWLRDIQAPTFVFEGTRKGNITALRAFEKAPHPPHVHFFEVDGATHFSLLAPITALIATKIAADTGAHPNIHLTHAELVRAVTPEPAYE